MSSRFTVDTTYLKIRDVFAFNANSGEVIQRDSVPVIGYDGHIDWKSSLEFISTVSVPTLSTTLVGALSLIQPGLSSLSTVYCSTSVSFIKSTVAGLGSLQNGNDYVSTSKLYDTVARLSGDYGYVSSTMLYDCINSLGNLSQIGGFLGLASNLGNVGYVSTIHPGEYKVYQSTLMLNGANATGLIITSAAAFSPTIIDIGGYMSHLVGSSKMKIDITTNLTLTHAASGSRIFQIYLSQNDTPIGIPVILSDTGTSLYIPNVSFLLKSQDINPTIPLQLSCYTDSLTQGTLTTLIPIVGGIHITLDNTD